MIGVMMIAAIKYFKDSTEYGTGIDTSWWYYHYYCYFYLLFLLFLWKDPSYLIQSAHCPKYKKKRIFEGHWKISIIANFRSRR